MQKRSLFIALLLVAFLPLRGFALSINETAEKLYASLSDEQKKEATLPLDAPERNKMQFTGGKRPGIKIRTLNDEQKKMAIELLTSFCSDYGKQKAMQIADQTIDNPKDDPGFERYYVCFFGDVGPGKTYAWRIAEHHLTLVHVEVEKGQPTRFGPILLGANPPTLWDDEEEKMIALFKAMTPQEREKANQQGKAASSEMPKGNPEGVRVGDLNPSAKEAARAVFDNRLTFFAEPVRKEIAALVDSEGGLDAMQIVFYGPAEKKCRDGGKWDFKMFSGGAGDSGKSFLCDYEGSRGHIHLSMRGQLQPSSKP